MKPTPDSFTQVENCCDFPVIPNRYLSFITGKIYNNEFFVNVMPMEGSNTFSKNLPAF
jgi:hypothetical protein